MMLYVDVEAKYWNGRESSSTGTMQLNLTISRSNCIFKRFFAKFSKFHMDMDLFGPTGDGSDGPFIYLGII